MNSIVEKDLDWIPIMHNATKWEKVSDNQYLLYNDYYQTKMFVSYSAIAIVSQINNANTIQEITDKLTSGKAKNIDYERVLSFIKDQLYKNGIIETENIQIKKKKSHIHLERIIIPEKILQKICYPFVFLFKKPVVLSVITFCAICNISILIKELPWQKSVINETNIIIFLIGLIILFLFHEIGHCTALQFFGKNSKGIGFGFYFFSPVLFADVNPSWTLSPNKKMVVDIGGFYFQFIITTVYLVFYEITDQAALLNIAYLSYVILIFNMNPLINTDMYWFISDALHHVNLNKEAMKELSLLFKKGREEKLNPFLLLFGMVKILFITIIFILITYFLIKTLHAIVAGKYMVSFYTVFKDIILGIGFIFFVREIINMVLKQRYKRN